MFAAIRHSAPYAAFKDWRRSLSRRLKLSQYVGTAHRCPVCGTGLDRFKPIARSFVRNLQEAGSAYTPASYETLNAEAYTCPACDASDRERLMVLYLERSLSEAGTGRTVRVLEFAPSNAMRNWLRSRPGVSYRDADLHRRTVADRVDISDMHAYADGSFDLVVCSHVLEHVPDDRRAMRELYRVIAPGGMALLLVPIVAGLDETQEDPAIDTETLRWRHYGSGDHIRQYGRRDFIDRLAAAGFAVETVGRSDFPPGALPQAGITERSTLYIALKA